MTTQKKTESRYTQSKLNALLEKRRLIYDARMFRKRFIPLEKIARNPRAYGYNRFDPIDSKAQQGPFIDDQSKVVAAIAGNRTGKTESAVIKFLKTCLNSTERARAWVVTESFDLQKAGVQEKLMEYLKPEDIISRQHVAGTALKELKIRSRHGKTITIDFKTFEQGSSKLQSAKLMVALIDEEPPEAIYNEVYTRTMDMEGQIILAFTPLKGFTWSYSRIYNSPHGDIKCYKWGMIDNIFVPREEIERAKRDWTLKQVRMRIYGEYQGAESQVFGEFDRSLHLRGDLYDEDLPVYIVIDWGVVVAAVVIMQKKKVVEKGETKEVITVVDAIELENVGYGHIMHWCMKRITERNYSVAMWICDPAGRARSQATRSGTSLLDKVKQEWGVTFNYVKRLGIEESIDLVSSYMMNFNGDVRFFVQEGIKLNDKGDTPEMRIEGYLRDEQTGKPIDDEVNTHICDCIRYGFINMTRRERQYIRQV